MELVAPHLNESNPVLKEIEEVLADHFVARGHTGRMSKTVARSFTHYMLGYVTEEGVAQYLVSGGADPEAARKMVAMFVDAKSSSTNSQLSGHFSNGDI